jgi:hypothetical protein
MRARTSVVSPDLRITSIARGAVCGPRCAVMLPRAVVVAALSIFGSSLSGSSLIENSPFIPEGFKANQRDTRKDTAKTDLAVRDIELRGIYSLDAEFYFNIFNKSAQKGDWVRLNDPNSSYRVIRFDEASNRIQINLDGKTEELYLRKPDNKPLPVKTAPAVAPTSPNQARAANTNNARSRRGNTPVVRRRVITPNRNRNARAPQRTQRTTGNQNQSKQQQNQQNAPRTGEELLRQLSNQQ